jgi:hypothetical protein
MAKRAADSTTEERLGDFAEDLGRFLGSTQAKASAWLDQRQKLLDSLMKVRDTAAHYIEQLGGSAAAPRRGRRPKAAAPTAPAAPSSRRPGRPRKQKRTLSPEARAKISAAQRARWARQRKAKGQ